MSGLMTERAAKADAKQTRERRKTLDEYRALLQRIAAAERPNDADIRSLAKAGDALELTAEEIDGDLAAMRRRRELEARKAGLEHAVAECGRTMLRVKESLEPGGEVDELMLKRRSEGLDAERRQGNANAELGELRDLRLHRPRLWAPSAD